MLERIKYLCRQQEQRNLVSFRLFRLVRKNFLSQNVWTERRSYAQLGEDLALHKLQGRCRRRMFLDVGCFHPLQYSNTRLLKEANWRGVHVDASKRSAELFRRTYPEDMVIDAIISSSEDIDSDQLAADEIWAKNRIVPRTTSSGAVADTAPPELEEDDRRFIEQSRRRVGAAKESVEILSPGELYETIAARMDAPLDSIGFLNLDIEGGELDFLVGWPFERCDFDLICVENHASNLGELLASELHRWLDTHGYELVWFFNFSTIYKRRA